MTQEDKELLLKDLSARLPYGVKMHSSLPGLYEKDFILDAVTIGKSDIYFNDEGSASYSKPYLFPMTSMTAEQYNEAFKDSKNNPYPESDLIDYLNAHHFDYRGLIDKGLAIDATNLNIY